MKINALSRIIRNRTLQHVAFWGLSYYTLLNILRISTELALVDFIFTGIFHISLVGMVYLNIGILVPKLLQKQHYLLYVLASAANLIVFSLVNILFFDHLIDYMAPGYYFISYYEFPDVLKFHLVYLILTTLLKLSKGWFEMNLERQKFLELERENISNELFALRSQINPHFLFNTLNNIYALTMKDSDRASVAILKLSGLLRYVLYESSAKKVKLSREIDFVREYVELQRIRSGSESNISITIEGEPNNKSIAPLLLLPLVENSFKHGIKGNYEDTRVEIRIAVSDKLLICSIRNNKPEKIDPGRGGLGIENLRRRLNLIYDNKHELIIKGEGKEYFT